MNFPTLPPKRQWIYLRDVLRELISRDFKLRYKRSFFGVAWSLLVPLAQLGVLSVVFNRILPLNIPNYTIFLFSGLLPWTWFQTALTSASKAITENRELVKQVGFPVGILPAVTVLSHMVHFLLSLPILAIFLVRDGYHFGPALLALPLVIAIQFVLISGLAYILAALQVIFRDTHHLLGVVLLLMFYATPIFWDSDTISGPLRPLVHLNPMALLLNAYRSILTRSEWPSVRPLLTVTVSASVLLWLGSMCFLRARERFVEEM
jgi:lipopolysaccharide transport system permease protein